MYLLIGTLCVCAATLMFSTALIGARNPVRPFWANEGMIAYLVPLILGILVIGCMLIFKSLFVYFPPSLMEVGYSIATLAAALGIFKILHVRKRLTDFASRTKSGQIVQVDFEAGKQTKQPGTPQSGYRKAV